MKINRIIVLISLVLAVFLYSCGKTSEQPKDNTKLPLVKVKEIAPSTFSESFKVMGTVKPYATAKISSEEGGLILAITKNKGDRVRAGEVLVRLKKDVEGATYDQMLAQYELAKINFEKQDELYKENATTEIQYLTAKWQMEAAEKGLDVLKTHIRKALVTSPINGVVDDKFMNKGEMSGPGIPILNVVDVSRVKISAGVPESYINEVKKSQLVSITLDVLPGAEFEGKISYLSPTLATGSRTFEIEIIIDNKDRLLKPEMSANIEIPKTEIENAVVIPQDLIVDYGDEKYVFVMEGDLAKKRTLEIGGRSENNVLITKGLNAGDRIIYEGFQSLKDGEKVQVVN
ncbi:MAG: efflux RND transporter periplasmic adaptor subunit [Ignavibacteria bacterium]